MNEKKVNGRLVLKEVSFDTMLIRKVGSNNATSGKITLPREMIGKYVYVILKEL